jgi:hypothetical protein
MGNEQSSSTDLAKQNKTSLIKPFNDLKDTLVECLKMKQIQQKELSKKLQSTIKILVLTSIDTSQEQLAEDLHKKELEEELISLLEFRLSLALKEVGKPKKVDFFNNHLKSCMFISNFIYQYKICSSNENTIDEKYESSFNNLKNNIIDMYGEEFWKYFSYACIDKRANKIAVIYDKIVNKKQTKEELNRYIQSFFDKNGEIYLNSKTIDELYD